MRGEDKSDLAAKYANWGSPPHARGRRRNVFVSPRIWRITPACAGKTWRSDTGPQAEADHPRMRGEDSGRVMASSTTIGSPPHARGRPTSARCPTWAPGITPACAGKTQHGHIVSDGDEGSPPHARGRLCLTQVDGDKTRITPACAGKTWISRPSWFISSDHPRMRGEDATPCVAVWNSPGSPPHARGRPKHAYEQYVRDRITPACAGKTFRVERHLPADADHPRMRGEDLYDAVVKLLNVGSPPHARGRRQEGRACVRRRRITPACAGKTSGLFSAGSSGRDHPRMRGEDRGDRCRSGIRPGSPPHARGRRQERRACVRRRRITPACAGKTLESLYRNAK